MSNHSKNEKGTSRRSFAKKLTAVLAAVPVSLVAARGVSGQRRTGKQRSRRQKRIEQVTPITIGGGSSVGISFNHRHYVGANGKYYSSDDEIHSAQVYDRFSSLKWELMGLVRDSNCTITIHTTKKNGTAPKEIIINSKPGGPFGVEFDDVEFILQADKKLHLQDDRKITGLIEVINNDDGLKATFTPPSDGICSIHLLNTKD